MRKFVAQAASVGIAVAALAAGTAGASTPHKAASVCPSSTVDFAIEPYDSGPALQKAYKSLAVDLSKKLGCTVKLDITSSYVAEIDSMAAGHIQIGEFGPLGYILAHKIADAQPVAAFGDKNGKPDTYTAGIWTPSNSGITSLKQLVGKQLDLSGTTSTSGGLYPIGALNQAGIKCTVPQASAGSCGGVKIDWTGGHPQDVEALASANPPAAAEVNSQEGASAASQKIWNPSNFRQIWKSAPIINDPITVYGKLPKAFQMAVKKALLSLTAKQTSVVDTELGTASNGPMVAATDGLYNHVRAIANAEGLKLSDLNLS
jgi:phosphonate transport system substrate-binding protein